MVVFPLCLHIVFSLYVCVSKFPLTRNFLFPSHIRPHSNLVTSIKTLSANTPHILRFSGLGLQKIPIWGGTQFNRNKACLLLTMAFSGIGVSSLSCLEVWGPRLCAPVREGSDNQPANTAHKTLLLQKVLDGPSTQSRPRLDLALFLNGAVAEKAKLYGESKKV